MFCALEHKFSGLAAFSGHQILTRKSSMISIRKKTGSIRLTLICADLLQTSLGTRTKLCANEAQPFNFTFDNMMEQQQVDTRFQESVLPLIFFK